MAIKTSLRPGGRSARVQDSVHQATRALLAELGRDAISLPLIASRAGVTPSTLYRRWGDLSSLLADVSLARMHPDADPVDTGSLRGDLLTWSEQYFDEINSVPGRAMLRDAVASDCTNRCLTILLGQLQTILERAASRGEATPSAEHLVDRVIAPGVFRILFGEGAPGEHEVNAWMDQALG
ncbi:TetR/AcrR family transcriptional regulator [Pseudomonas matsuisoli]|uniref:TetR family transcriptional regulator n=1 Tax=Pseudomonas matsuisoli TaxID=1515666 RepID=A0A917V0B8_9PSED|nr:TetR/AcrR family transcriptional regulator [Pseudomonas matsuisoli]GGK06565.1 TetR family transcriptional regulator [Pseudomonas matsuisoli]